MDWKKSRKEHALAAAAADRAFVSRAAENNNNKVKREEDDGDGPHSSGALHSFALSTVGCAVDERVSICAAAAAAASSGQPGAKCALRCRAQTRLRTLSTSEWISEKKLAPS